MSKGFTLIEFVMALGILAVILAAIAASYKGGGNVQARDGAIERLRQAMLQARSNAQDGKKSCAINIPLTGWRVKVAANSFTVVQVCNLVETNPKTENLTTGLTAATVTTINFPPLGGNVTTLAPVVALPVTIRISGVNPTRSFQVSANGQISPITSP